jgi:hypothetical protein
MTQATFNFTEKHKRPNQAAQILSHLEHGRSLTAMDALNLFGCFRLAARVHELRAQGHHIEERVVVTPGGKRVAEYTLNT